MNTSKHQDQTLALAGVFQAAELVHQAASQGAWSGFAAAQSIQSLFKLTADSVEDIYDGPYGVKLGLQSLTHMLSGQNDQVQALKYAVSLLQLEPRFTRRRRMQQTLIDELEQIGRLSVAELAQDETDQSLLEQKVEALAKLYQETVSTIEPRIIVHGKPGHLKQQRNLNWIRALLFAGLRSAVLWRQLGGNRWSLLFGRKKLLQSARRWLSA